MWRTRRVVIAAAAGLASVLAARGRALGAVTAMVLAFAVAASGPAAGSVSGHAKGRAGLARATAIRAGTLDSARRAAGRQRVPGFPFRSILPASIHLTGNSCVTGSFCVAVGSYADPLGHSRSLAERWNGRTWRVMPGVHGSGLAAVSCASTRFCMALGSPAQRWDGRAWTATPTPRGLRLAGISCLRPSFCMAVGSGMSRDGFACESAAAWNGTRWRAFPVLNPCRVIITGFTSVSCLSASMCMAVGASLEPDNKTDLTLAEAWNGRKWRVLATPAPGVESLLSGVSCPTATFCMAVGVANFQIMPPCTGTAICNIALTWNGSTWQRVNTPGAGGLSAVSCATAASCIAVSGSQAMAWDGTTWTPLTLAQPGTAAMSLPGIACWNGTGCMAVGAYGTLDGASLPLAEQWNGSAWRVRRTPGPGDAFNGLSGVSCPSVTRCMAVGNRIDGSDVQVTLAERWDGRRWRALATPSPGAHLNVLTAVSCPTMTNCMAVGYYDAAGGLQAFAEQWNGASWTTLVIPHNGALKAVSCPAINKCMAVGSYLTSGRRHALSATWDGTTWTVQASPDLGGSLTEFIGVSCAGGSDCMAVGDHNTGATNPLLPLTARWNGTAWKVLATPIPGGAGGLTSVWCARPASCMAVGSHFAKTGHVFPTTTLAESWNGRRWRVRATPAITGQLRPLLTAVSCGTQARCIAAGGFLSPSGKAHVLAEAWNGTVWRRLAIPSPDPAFNYLYAVACPAAARCVAAGEQGVQRTSAYRWNGASWLPLRPANP